jgi:hypothetical protein
MASLNAGLWCNNHLEKYEFVNGKDDIPYMKWKNKIHIPNHQAAYDFFTALLLEPSMIGSSRSKIK